MQTVEEIADEILDREGGYVNDRDDPGGATNHGVTIHTMRRLGLDLDRDGDVDATDVRRLTKAQAREIFIREGMVTLRWDGIIGRTYRVDSADTLSEQRMTFVSTATRGIRASSS